MLIALTYDNFCTVKTAVIPHFCTICAVYGIRLLRRNSKSLIVSIFAGWV